MQLRKENLVDLLLIPGNTSLDKMIRLHVIFVANFMHAIVLGMELLT
jgi:hypothetical protein